MMRTRAPQPAAVREFNGRRVSCGQGTPHEFTYFTVETARTTTAPQPHSERREDRRVSTRLREGIVFEAPGRGRQDCFIRDLSRTGAKLQLVKARPLPRNFLLTDTATSKGYRAKLMWQVGRDVGVKLVPL